MQGFPAVGLGGVEAQVESGAWISAAELIAASGFRVSLGRRCGIFIPDL